MDFKTTTVDVSRRERGSKLVPHKPRSLVTSLTIEGLNLWC